MSSIARVSMALSCLVALAGSACGDDGGGSASGSGGSGGSNGNGGGTSGGGVGDGGSSGSNSPGSSGSNSPTASSGSSGSVTGSQVSSSVQASSGVATVAAVTSTGAGGDDAFAAERQACVDKINALRATEGLPGIGRWGDAEMCSDEAATSDEQSGTPHGAFQSCGESGQNECLGHGPQGNEQCLEQMWAEKDLPECTGCYLCHEQQGNCDNCVFAVCGHYVNMSALYFTEVACGFSDLGGWNVHNFR